MSEPAIDMGPPRPQAFNFLAGGGEMGALMRAFDWAQTPLGPASDWPQSLKTSVRIMLTSRQPIWIGWGEQLTFLYNDAYKPIIGGKHPWALGRPTSEVWREIWSDIGPLLDTAMGGVEGIYVEEQLLIMERNGYAEETYYTFSYSPIPDDAGEPGGIICANSEDTPRVVGERQIGLLRELATRVADARNWREACERSSAALARDPHDVIFHLLYMGEAGGGELRLTTAAGLEPGHPAVPVSLPMSGEAQWSFAPAVLANEVQVIDDLAARLPGVQWPCGVWERSVERAAILPIPAKGETGRPGVLIVGLNPHRLFDDNYLSFLRLVSGQLAAAVANADAYEAERRRAEALAELDLAKTTFFSNVSHEFRTPLTLMLGPLEDLLSSTAPGEPAHAPLALAHRNGVRLLRLVNSLLDFSRIEAGRARAEYQPTYIGRFTAEIASGFRSAMERAGLRLELDCERLARPVYVDREMWEKVVLNLLSNAFKFTFEGAVSVRVRESQDGGSAQVEIADTGIGIPEAELPRLFERFHRVEGARGRSFEGSGIGLALVQELVRLHGGAITAESRPGEGTRFTISIPFGRTHLPAGQVHETEQAPERLTPTRTHEFLDEALRWLPDGSPDLLGSDALAPAPGLTTGEGRRVLLADDNADMRNYVQRLLEAQGYQVEATPNGATALAAAKRSPPDLVLTDVMMPGLDGFGLLRELRRDPAAAATPVIMLSARAGEEAKVEGLEAGADDYLVKPFAARELLARVNANIQMAEIRREANRAVFRSEQRMLLTEDRLAIALSTGRVGVFEWELDADRVFVLGPLAELFGVTPETAAAGSLPLADYIQAIDPSDQARVVAAIDEAVRTSAPYEAEYTITGGGAPRLVVARGAVRTGPAGTRRMSGALIDITHERAAQAALEERGRALQLLNQAAAAMAGDLDLDRLVQTITDAGTEVSGAQYGAFFYNVTDGRGERYMLYTLSGASREAFADFAVPRITAVLAPTFTGQGVVRSDDITVDERYGRNAPFRGLPPGHLAVRSYLAAPVRSRTGEVLGGLLFGHPDPGVFGPLAEERITGLASQAAVAIDNARLFQAVERELEQRRRAETELQALNATLEERVGTEVAERAKAEAALRQAQKMEAVGQLTGGVAHDFNNLLTIIIGGLDTIRRARPGDDARVRRATDMALQGAQRAASLTTRLLAFSRRQPLDPKPLDLNALVRDMTELLHRTLGEQVELESVLAPRLWAIEADQNQLENALLNLAVNARDAMAEGGKLTIETSNTLLDESYVAVDAEVVPGQYVAVCVSDTGDGMSKATLAKVFEPFFTTKEVGRGTGLGLSMVYGFVKQSGGHVTIYSEEGHGTTVRLYFPRFHGGVAAGVAATADDAPSSGDGEVILVVEDNAEVRSYSVMVLKELGYVVLEAGEAESALAILRSSQRVDLLFTDVVLPGPSGRVLVDTAMEVRPELKVLFTTGYSRNAIIHHGRLDHGVQLITKPFTFEQLAARVRDVLDRAASRS